MVVRPSGIRVHKAFEVRRRLLYEDQEKRKEKKRKQRQKKTHLSG